MPLKLRPIKIEKFYQTNHPVGPTRVIVDFHINVNREFLNTKNFIFYLNLVCGGVDGISVFLCEE